jgi:uncharacterized membrane protein YhiD involved in acid resistance
MTRTVENRLRVVAGRVSWRGVILWRSKQRHCRTHTAASIWVTAGIGLAAGAGLYGLSVMVALLAFIVLRLPHIRD